MEKDIRYVRSAIEDLAFMSRSLRESSSFKVIKILQAYNIAIELRKIKKLAEASAGFWG